MRVRIARVRIVLSRLSFPIDTVSLEDRALAAQFLSLIPFDFSPSDFYCNFQEDSLPYSTRAQLEGVSVTWEVARAEWSLILRRSLFFHVS